MSEIRTGGRHKAGEPGRDQAWGMRIPVSAHTRARPFCTPLHPLVTLTGWVKEVPNTLKAGQGLGYTLCCRTCFGFHARKNWLLLPNYAAVPFPPPCWRVGTLPGTSFYSSPILTFNTFMHGKHSVKTVKQWKISFEFAMICFKLGWGSWLVRFETRG